jgi:zinc transporter ZupT
MMPYLLAFAAGAMLGTVGFAAGFALMMVLDVLLG